jgi:hypothetical protein
MWLRAYAAAKGHRHSKQEKRDKRKQKYTSKQKETKII